MPTNSYGDIISDIPMQNYRQVHTNQKQCLLECGIVKLTTAFQCYHYFIFKSYNFSLMKWWQKCRAYTHRYAGKIFLCRCIRIGFEVKRKYEIPLHTPNSVQMQHSWLSQIYNLKAKLHYINNNAIYFYRSLQL